MIFWTYTSYWYWLTCGYNIWNRSRQLSLAVRDLSRVVCLHWSSLVHTTCMTSNSDPCIIGLTLFAAFPIVSHSAAASAANRRASVPTIASIAGLSFSQVERTCSSTERACNQRPRSCLCTTRTALMRTRTPTCPASNLTVCCLARRGCPSPAPSSPCFCFSQNATKPYYEK